MVLRTTAFLLIFLFPSNSFAKASVYDVLVGGTLKTLASSPQAKGRVERIHGTHQDRLVKKLRRKQIASHGEANAYLEGEYLREHNRRFARAAARPEDYHRRTPCAAELDRIFRLESERVISDDWVVRYDNRFFQLEPQSRHYAPARGKVVVGEGPDGRVGIEYRGRAVPWREIPAPARPRVARINRLEAALATATQENRRLKGA